MEVIKMENNREIAKNGFIHMRINKELKERAIEVAKDNYTDLTQMITDYLVRVVKENNIY